MHRITARDLIVLGLMVAAIATAVSWNIVVRVVPRVVVPIAVGVEHKAMRLH